MNSSVYFLIYCLFFSFSAIQDIRAQINFWEINGMCLDGHFRCHKSRNCIPVGYVCDGEEDCGQGDLSDETNCGNLDFYAATITSTPKCVSGSFLCPESNDCVFNSTICDGKSNCPDGSDENNCDVEKVADFSAEKQHFSQWFLDKRSNGTVNKWGLQVHRTAVALYFAKKELFVSDEKIGEELRYELTIHLLSVLNRRDILRTDQLALYVHAMVVTCLNPRDFYKHDLVSDLRKRVDSSKYTSPLAILVLCNAGADMTAEDVNRLNRTFTSQHRPFWTEVQAMSAMALSCISSKTSVPVEAAMLEQWVKTVIGLQLENGTVGNPRTTALVIQMLLGTGYSDGFNWRAATRVIQEPHFISSSNFLDRYYLIPVLNNRSPTTIDSSHCPQISYNADIFRKMKERTNVVHYSVWMNQDIDFGRSWRLRMSSNSSFYDVILKVQSLEPTHIVKFNMVDGKPYVRSVNGLEEDPETGHYWFTYVRTIRSTEDPMLLEESPVDISTEDNQELILWYRNGVWNSESYGSGDHA